MIVWEHHLAIPFRPLQIYPNIITNYKSTLNIVFIVEVEGLIQGVQSLLLSYFSYFLPISLLLLLLLDFSPTSPTFGQVSPTFPTFW